MAVFARMNETEKNKHGGMLAMITRIAIFMIAILGMPARKSTPKNMIVNVIESNRNVMRNNRLRNGNRRSGQERYEIGVCKRMSAGNNRSKNNMNEQWPSRNKDHLNSNQMTLITASLEVRRFNEKGN